MAQRLDFDEIVTEIRMDEYVWVLRKNASSDVPIGARVLARFGPRIKIKDDDHNEYWVSPEEIIRPMHPTSITGVDDMISLGELDEFSILRNLQIRYMKDLIYTYIGSILVAVNPYKSLPIYDKWKMAEYRRKRLGELPPHIFAVADHSYENMRKLSEKRCIVISGESGAGKTESTKLFLRYFASISPKLSGKEKQILDSNPILEAFGNAKTVCNDNSSRFGKYISIIFNRDGSVNCAQIKQYLLEKSRIVSQNQGEQNYHIFYALLTGLPEEEKHRLNLKDIPTYNYLNRTSGISNDISQVYSIEEIKSAMKVLKFSEEEIWSIFETIAMILHFGNIEFETVTRSNLEGVDSAAKKEIESICSLLQVPEQLLIGSLTQKTISTHGDNVIKFLSKQEAINSRDAFVKKIFENLFNFIVDKINAGLSGDGKTSSWHIGILDIFGFEAFDRNSFEQMCINYANEKLQQFFIGHVLKTEQDQYAIEEINWEFVEYPDNTEILNLIETGPESILSVINDATKIPKGSDQTMLEKLIEFHSENPYFLKPKYQHTLVFGIKHFAGIVLYDTKDFVEKNHDACSLDVKRLIQNAGNDFLKKIFSTDFEADSTAYYKKRMETLISKFKSSLDSLMIELNECRPFFVRCIKPSETKKPQKFDRMLCCKQLRYSGMTEVTKVREAGYPVRYDFVQFVQHYRMLVPGIPLAHKTSCKEATQRICQTVLKKFQNPDYRLGRTKIFLKHAEGLFLEAERERVLYSHAIVIQKVVRGWLARRRLFRLKNAVALAEKRWEAKRVGLQEFQRFRQLIISFQAWCRGYLMRRSLKKKLEDSRNRNQIKTSENPTESADFKEFAKRYFQEKQTHRFCKKPLKNSLTRLVRPEEKIAAKAIWLTILRYTKNISERLNKPSKAPAGTQLKEILKTIGAINKDSASPFQGDTEIEDCAEKLNRLYDDWLKTQTTEIQKLCFIIGHGIKRSELRDEIYCQICKILTKNPSKKAARSGWQLLSFCTGCFPPSDLFLKYLKSFIREGDSKFTSFCLFRLHRTIQNGTRTQPPFSTELEAIKRQKPINLDVFLMNGMTTSVKIDSATTSEELLHLVAKNIKLREVFGFCLVLGQELRSLPLGDGSRFVLDAVSEYEQYASEVAAGSENMHWQLILKKDMFAPWHEHVEDEVATELTYHQIKEGILIGEYGFQDAHLPSLIAMICYVDKGKLRPSELNEAISSIPPPLSSHFSEEFQEQAVDAYQRMFKEKDPSVDSVRAEIVNHAALNWKVEFSRFFRVIGSIRNLKGSEPYPQVPLLVGVNSSGIFIIDESSEKRIIARMSFMEIRELNRKEMAENHGYILKITNYEEIEVSLVFGSEFDIDLHKLLLKITETLKNYSKFVLCIKNYDSEDGSFLHLKKGDLITLSDRFYGRDLLRNSWAEGYNHRSGETGNFVLENVQIIPTMQKPSEYIVKAMGDALARGKRTSFCQNTERLKHYSIESYADKYFRTSEHKGRHEGASKKSLELWKYSKENIQKPLHAQLVNKEKEAKLATEIFSAILRYTENEEPIKTEEELVFKIFGPGLENVQLRDETYCQLMKQLTCNINKRSENKTWELMWMITGLFPCGELLTTHVKKFLQSRRTIHIARECLVRFFAILNVEPRNHPPHVIEIEAVQNRPCHIFHRIYFPDDTHKFFQITSITKVTELKEAIFSRLGINLSKKGFHLFVQILERLFLIPENHYVFDYLQVLKKWMEKNRLAKTKWDYKICLMKSSWKSSTPGYDKITDIKFIFPQEYKKYIQGHYEIPSEYIVELAGLLYLVFCSNEATQQFQRFLQKLVPHNAVNLMRTESYEKEIQRCCTKYLSSSKEECKVKFLQQLNKFSSQSLPYFVTLAENSNLKNYILFPVTINSSFNV